MLTAQKNGEEFWIGTQPDPKDRTIIKVSAEDAALIKGFHGEEGVSARVKDLVTGKFVVVQPASCGLINCRCALDFFNCQMCVEVGEGFGPRHNGSKSCLSGSIASGGVNAHCTCDTCF